MNSSEKLLELINETNLPPKLLTDKNVTFGPVVIDDSGDDNNTALVITGVPINGYRGDVTVHYKRLDLSDIVDENLRTTSTLDKTTVVGLINQAYGMFLIEDDLEDYEVPTLDFDNPQATISLVANVNSIGFVGSVELTLEFGNAYLEGVIHVRILSTLKHPIKVGVNASARMLTWNKDFTSIAAALVPDPKTGTYTDWDTVQAAAAYYGIPTWTKGSITDHPTSSVPDANPAFDRVVIQKSTVIGKLEGDLYLHYNVI